MGETLAAAVVIGGGVILGFVIGRWWALLGVLLIPVASIPAGRNPDGMPEWQIALFAYAPLVLVGLAAGVGTRRILARRA